jgi:hypothetical protein
LEAIIKKISMFAALLFLSAVVGGSAAFAQATGEQNSGAGVPALPGNKSGPVVTPPLKNPGQESSGYRQDQSRVAGLPGNKSGPALQHPTGLQDRAQGGEEESEDHDSSFRHHPGMMGMMGRAGRGVMHATTMRIIFSLIDADGDGKITLEEWQAAQERIFKAMDTDHDGTVTFQEMQAFIHGR